MERRCALEEERCVEEGISPRLKHHKKSGQKRTDVPVWRQPKVSSDHGGSEAEEQETSEVLWGWREEEWGARPGASLSVLGGHWLGLPGPMKNVFRRGRAPTCHLSTEAAGRRDTKEQSRQMSPVGDMPD